MPYKFLNLVDGKIKSNIGDTVWKINEWKHENKIDICNCGFHCSSTILDALSFIQGEILAEVEVKGKSEKQKNKSVHTDMRLIRAWYWTKNDSVALSIYAAELCIKNFEKLYPNNKRPRQAIKAAKEWLKNPTEKNRLLAESAAWSAAWSAESATWSAALAAESATWSAAKSAALAAKSAALAAEDKINKQINKWLISHLKEMKIYE
jgi:hypothetical protein